MTDSPKLPQLSNFGMSRTPLIPANGSTLSPLPQGEDLTVDHFDFFLPPELIAQHPAPDRTGSRLLHVTPDALTDRRFTDLPGLLGPGDLLVFNDTRVIRARLYGHKETGGQVEILVERIVDDHEALAQVRASKSPRAGTRLILEGETPLPLTVGGRAGEFFVLRTPPDQSFWDILEQRGKLPLPPYITHGAATEDETRYQTVFAREPGAVAAPTAGLHFDEALLATLAAQGVRMAYLTLHVGAGTFQPVRVDRVADHRMHSERYTIPAATTDAIAETRRQGGRVVAVGTTSLRALESAARQQAPGVVPSGSGETDIFITPGYRFQVVDRLITNFHLPRSTLLMLVSAFAGYDRIRSAYAHAVAARYRFFSYGDAMLLEKSHAI